jgi:DnaJ-class molecular chaperone
MTPDDIRSLAAKLDALDYFALLGVARTAQPSDVRAAYHRQRREIHPDAYLDRDPDLKSCVDRIATRITEAYVVLRDGARRAAYEKSLGSGELRYTPAAADEVRKESAEQLGKTPSGRRFYALALEAERQGDVARAISQLKMALTFEGQNERFKAKLADLQARQTRARKK